MQDLLTVDLHASNIGYRITNKTQKKFFFLYYFLPSHNKKKTHSEESRQEHSACNEI